MIAFKAKRLTLLAEGYGMQLPGNDGEEMLAFFMAWGQDRKTQLVIVSASVDDAVRVLVTSGKRMILANVLATCDRVIEKWSMHGVKPTAPEKEYLTAQRKKVCDMIACFYETGELKPIKKKGKKKNKDAKFEERIAKMIN